MDDVTRIPVIKLSHNYYSKARRDKLNRVVVWFSAGAASAVASKLTLAKYKGVLPVHIAYCDTGSEHEDNERFLKDCEEWFDHPIERLKSEKYENIWDVFDKTNYLVGIAGARCTTELKKVLRQQYENLESDIQVFGYDFGEIARAERFRESNMEVYLETPLIDRQVSKGECLAILEKANIELPIMYQLGYKNNNCIGCVKGGAGYWNKIRKDFPDTFERMSQQEQRLGVAINKRMVKVEGQTKRKREKLFLKDLPEDMGRYEAEPDISCGLSCAAAWVDMNDGDDMEDCET
jgi:3'-phosphoadenosine 5'-phosphosulfate sulfotransferase (PAPS reductase)/FAD synthetase